MKLSPEELETLLKLIADDSCRKILLEIRRSEIYSEALAQKLGMPKSTVWKKLKELEEISVVEAYAATGGIGRRVKMYKFRDRELNFKSVSDLLQCFEDK